MNHNPRHPVPFWTRERLEREDREFYRSLRRLATADRLKRKGEQGRDIALLEQERRYLP